MSSKKHSSLIALTSLVTFTIHRIPAGLLCPILLCSQDRVLGDPHRLLTLRRYPPVPSQGCSPSHHPAQIFAHISYIVAYRPPDWTLACNSEKSKPLMIHDISLSAGLWSQHHNSYGIHATFYTDYPRPLYRLSLINTAGCIYLCGMSLAKFPGRSVAGL